MTDKIDLGALNGKTNKIVFGVIKNRKRRR